jgi:Schlafen, AlbA_2
MPTIPEQLFESLSQPNAIHALVGKTEDLHLDCKVWPAKDEDAQRMIAKAVCGFANGDGGVIVVGMRAKTGPNKDDPDQIQASEPVADTTLVKTKIQDLIGQLIEPGIVGVRVDEINDPADKKSGFVTALVPATDGPPCRSRKDWKFYQRISSGTYPMEYFQIADMFGKRHRPVLELHLIERGIEGSGNSRYRPFDLGITNAGRAIAKYPGLRYKNVKGMPRTMVLQGSAFGLPLRQQHADWLIFGGGVDHIIYPGETLLIAKLHQAGREDYYPPRFVFPKWDITVQLSAEGTETKVIQRTFEGLATFL